MITIIRSARSLKRILLYTMLAVEILVTALYYLIRKEMTARSFVCVDARGAHVSSFGSGKRELLLSGRFGVEVQAILFFGSGLRLTVGKIKKDNFEKYEQNVNKTKIILQNNIYQNILKNACKNTLKKWRK